MKSQKTGSPIPSEESGWIRDGIVSKLPVKGTGVKTSPLVSKTTLVRTGDGKTVCCYRSAAADDEDRKRDMNGATPSSELHTRQRMRPWLEARINSQEISGLEWKDPSSKVFRVPWKHVGNREWTESDGKIFKEWAIHTGRYREGVDEPDWPTWKTRFRCALTKLPDIRELKDQNQLDGQTDEPYRVYQFVPRINNGMHTTVNQWPIYNEDFEPKYFPGTPAPMVFPTTIESGNSTEQRLDSDLNNIPSGDLIVCNSTEMRELRNGEDAYDDMDTSDDIPLNGSDTVELTRSQLKDIANKAQKNYPDQANTKPPALTIPWMDSNDSKLYITIKYRQEIVHEGLSTSNNGCRIYYDVNVDISTQGQELYNNIFGPMDALPLCLPECRTSNGQQLKLTSQLLRVTDRGVVVKMENGNIIATRKCRCSIYVSSPSFHNGETTKLIREKPTVIFDLNRYFRPALDKYLHQTGPKPSAEVVMCFGQRFDKTRESLSNLLISASIVHTEANNVLTSIACTSPLSPPIEISASDNYDRYLDMLSYTCESPSAH